MHTKDYLALLFTTICLCFCIIFFANKSYAASFTEGNLIYAENEDGTLTVIGYTSPEDGSYPDIIINNTVNNKTVTEIASSAFKEQNFSTVFIDNNIAIGAHAFNNTHIFHSLTIGTDDSGSNIIDKFAFAYATMRRTYINSNVELRDYCFRNATFQSSIIHNSILTTIGKGAFMNSDYIEGLNCSSLISIGENAFFNTDIRTFTIPSTIKEIGKNAFAYDYVATKDRLKIHIDASITNINNFHFEDLDTALLGIDAQSSLVDYCVTNNLPHFLVNEAESSASKANINQVLFGDSYTIMVNGSNTATLLSLYSDSDYICIDEQYNIDYHGYTYAINNIDQWAIMYETCPYVDTIELGDSITQLEIHAIVITSPHTITLSQNMQNIVYGAYNNDADVTTIIIPPGLTTLTEQIATCFKSMVVVYSVNENNPLVSFFQEQCLTYHTYKSTDSDDSESDNESTPNSTFTEGYLTYTENEDGTLTVMGYDPEQYLNFVPLIIKNTVNGRTVTKIAERAFQDKEFQYIAIDNNIDIGAFAFKNVSLDEGKFTDEYEGIIPEYYNYSVCIGNDNTGSNKIDKYAFAFSDIRGLAFLSNITIGDYSFKDTQFERIYQLDSTVTHIGKNAFDGSTYSSGLNYSGLISVSSDAFNGCSLSEFTISSTLESLDITFSGGTSTDYFDVYIADNVKDISAFHMENLPYTIFHIGTSSSLNTYLSANNMTYTVAENEDPYFVYSKPGIGQIISNNIYTARVNGNSTASLIRLNQPSDLFSFDFNQNAIIDYHGYHYTITSIASYAIRPENCSYIDSFTFDDTITKIEAYAITTNNYDLAKIVLTDPSTVIEEWAFPNSSYLTIELLPSVTTLDNYSLCYLTDVTFLVAENSPLIQMLVDRNLTFQTPGNDPIKPGSPEYPKPTTSDPNQKPTTEETTTEDNLSNSDATTEDSNNQNPTEETTTEESSNQDNTEQTTTEESNNQSSTDTNNQNGSGEADTNVSSSQTKKRPSKGTTFTYKKLKYKVTGKSTVTFMKPLSKKITKLTIPATITYNSYKFKVTKVNKKACYQCSKLKNVTVGNNVTEIGDNAFAKCSVLKNITFGTNVKKLGKKVLYHDKKLSKITFKGKKLKSIGKQTFRKVPKSVRIIVPNSKVKKYSKLINNAI